MPRVNHLAIIIAAVVHFLLGAVWFTAFSAPWRAGLRMSPEEIQRYSSSPSPVPYILSFCCNVLIAYVLAWVITRTGAQTLFRGLLIGLVLGVGIAAAAMATEMAFEMRDAKFIAISAGYPMTGMLLMGAIIGAWKKKPALAETAKVATPQP
jgi:uncharacterized protein DUF1761